METAVKTGTAGRPHAGAAALQRNAVPDVAPSTEGALPFFGGLPVQAKLEVSPPDDPQEREADSVADEVMRMPEAGDTMPVQAAPAQGLVQMKCAACEAEENVQRFPEPAVQRENIIQRKCAACGQEEKVQRKCAACEAEESIQRFPEPAVQRESIIQRKCAACEQEEKVQRKCAACEAEETVQRFAEPAPQRTNVIQRSCDECKIGPPEEGETAEDNETEESLVDQDPSAAGISDDEAASMASGGGAEAVNPKSAPGGPAPVSSQFESGLQSSKGGGQPMAEPVRRNMESRFGLDFGDVRIHNGHGAANLSASINAQAFTHGKDIYFNQNKYDGSSASGQRLLAHELTHVVQQTGSSVVKPKIQRFEEPKIGNWAHSWIQKHMRDTDNKMITEAGIPGAIRSYAALNVAGFADLYKADNNAVSGMQMHYVKGKEEYIRFMDSGERLKQMLGPFVRGPIKNKQDKWDFTINFPERFEIGEIKPLYWREFGKGALTLIGGGLDQQSNYIKGFEAFVKHVHTVFPAARPSTKGAPMDLTNRIPDGMNYDKFDAEHTKLSKGHQLKIDSKQRLWVANVGNGIAGYFLMPHPYIPTEYAEDKKKHRDKLDKLIKDLREKAAKPAMPGALNTKRIQCKPAVTAAVKPEAVLRKPDSKADKAKMHAAADAWEKERKEWVHGTGVPQQPKKFLKERAKGLLKRNKVDKALKRSTPTDAAKEIKQAKDIRFWSSFKGRVFGALRFRFGTAFSKVEELFKKVKDKFEKHREKSKTLKGGKKFTVSWKKEAVNLIVEIAVDIFQRMIAAAFKRFSECMNAIVETAIGKIEKALEEMAEEELKKYEPQCCEIMKFKNTWEKEVESHEKEIKFFTETVDDMREWTAVLDQVEIAVRLGVQIISCGTPPALGCLWGLVAQLGISAGMQLLMKTDYWKNSIAQPAAEALMEAIVGDALHDMMINALRQTELAPFMTGDACQTRPKGGGGSGGIGAIGKGLDKIDPNDPAIAKARAEWENQYKDQIMADLQAFFESGEKGKKLTPEDFQKLVDAIKNSGKTPEEIRKMVDEGRNTKTGKVDFTKALTSVTSGTVPGEKPRKERKIDYEKAKRNNLYYHNVIRWLETLFIKKPGIKPGSEEFADAVYDMQEALGIHADGIAGPGTTQKFYEANGLNKDDVYSRAGEVLTREKEAKEQQKELAEKKKELEALLSDPKVQEALNKPYPSNTQLKADLEGFQGWSGIPAGTGKFILFEGRAAVLLVTAQGKKIGAYLKYVESEEGGKKMAQMLTNGPFFAIDAIEGDEDAFALEGIAKDGKTKIIALYFLSPQAAGSFAKQSEYYFFGIRMPKQ